MDNVAATLAMGVHNPTPTISRHGTAITPRPTGSTELVSDDSPGISTQHMIFRPIRPKGRSLE